MKVIFVVLFFLTIFIPLFKGLDSPNNLLFDNRSASPAPTLKAKFPWVSKNTFKSLENYINDRVPFRDWSITTYSRFFYDYFDVAVSPRVIKGRKDWLFLTDNNMFDNYKGLNPFSEDDLIKANEVIDSRINFLKKQKIHYLFFVAPNKASIDREYLPDYLKPYNNPRYILFNKWMKNSFPENYLDIKTFLLERKRNGEMAFYMKHDTHWSSETGFYVYKEIEKKLKKFKFNKIEIVNLKERKTVNNAIRDLSVINALGYRTNDGFEIKTNSLSGKIDEEKTKWLKSQIPGDKHQVLIGNKVKKDILLILRDSFFTDILPYFSQNFKEIYAIWIGDLSYFPIELFNKIKPRLVIQEVVERALNPSMISRMEEIIHNKDFKNQILLSEKDIFVMAKGTYGLKEIKNSRESEFYAINNDPQIIIEAPKKFKKGIIYVDIYSSKDSFFQLFFKKAGESFEENKSIIKNLKKGKSVLRFYVKSGFNLDQFRFDPIATKGEFKINNISFVF